MARVIPKSTRAAKAGKPPKLPKLDANSNTLAYVHPKFEATGNYHVLMVSGIEIARFYPKQFDVACFQKTFTQPSLDAYLRDVKAYDAWVATQPGHVLSAKAISLLSDFREEVQQTAYADANGTSSDWHRAKASEEKSYEALATYVSELEQRPKLT